MFIDGELSTEASVSKGSAIIDSDTFGRITLSFNGVWDVEVGSFLSSL